MKTKGLILSALALLMIAVVLVGCKKKEEPAPPPPEQKSAMEKMTEQAETMKKTATEATEEAKETVTEAAAQTEQTMCPVMDNMKINPDVFTEYQGKKVYFCCPDCKAKFEVEPEKYIANLPQFKK